MTNEVQYQTGDGTCLYAMRHARPVLIDDTAAHKLRDLAACIVTSVSGEPPRPAPPFEDG